jgi:predicted amidohydrolase YtcJ
VKKMLAAGLPVGGGTDATRVASYNPWIAMGWLVTGRTVGGLSITPAAHRLDRETALRLYTGAARGSRAKRARKASSSRASSPTSRFFPPT